MSPEPLPSPGLLVAVVGPSGAGKDTLIRLALDGWPDASPPRLARRVVTRPADGGSEDHDSLDRAAFEAAEAAGAFCLTWRAHGLAYGLPRAVEASVAGGGLVLANLSRRALVPAAARFGRLALVEVTARPDLLLARIAARGREPPAEIAARLARQIPVESPPNTFDVLSLDNSGPPREAADALRDRLRRWARTCG